MSSDKKDNQVYVDISFLNVPRIRYFYSCFHCFFFFFVKPRYPRRWSRLISQSGWQGLPKRPSADEEEGRTPNLVSDESMSTAPPGPLRYVFTVDCLIGQIVARKYGIRNFINFLKAIFNFKNK
jgi:hypothetical protein